MNKAAHSLIQKVKRRTTWGLSIRIFQIAIFVLIFYFLAPFIKISLYNLPQADDFCSSLVKYEEYFRAVLNWYQNTNGRYFNALVVSLPFWYQISVYKLIFFVFSIIYILSISGLIKIFLSNLKIYENILVSLFLYLLFLIFTPKISSSFYWFSGITAYLFSFTLFIFLTVYFIRFFLIIESFSLSRKLGLCLLIIMAVGSHEITMVFVIILAGLFFLNSMKTRYKIRETLFYLTVALLSSMFVVFSPGTKNRSEKYEDRESIFQIGRETINDTYAYILHALKSEEFFIFSILALVFLYIVVPRNKKLFNIRPEISLFFVMMSIIVIAFIFNYSTGNYNPLAKHRYTNILYYYSSFTYLVFLYSVVVWIKSKFRVSIPFGAQIFLFSFVMFIQLLLIYNTTNFNNARWVLNNNVIQNYNSEWLARKNFVEAYQDNNEIIYVPNYNFFPVVLLFDDLTDDDQNWKNQCYSDNFRLKRPIITNTDNFFTWLKRNTNFETELIDQNLHLVYISSFEAKKYHLPIISNQLFINYDGKEDAGYYVKVISKDTTDLSIVIRTEVLFFNSEIQKATKIIDIPDSKNFKVELYGITRDSVITELLKTVALN